MGSDPELHGNRWLITVLISWYFFQQVVFRSEELFNLNLGPLCLQRVNGLFFWMRAVPLTVYFLHINKLAFWFNFFKSWLNWAFMFIWLKYSIIKKYFFFLEFFWGPFRGEENWGAANIYFTAWGTPWGGGTSGGASWGWEWKGFFLSVFRKGSCDLEGSQKQRRFG